MRGRNPVRVLLVDDDVDFLLIWRILLARDDRFGWVDEAGCGEEALRHLQSGTPPDVVVSDVCMGAVSGFDVLDCAIRIAPGTAVVLTSSAEGMRTEALHRGATAFLAKSETTAENFAHTVWAATRVGVGLGQGDEAQGRRGRRGGPRSEACREIGRGGS